MHITCNRTDVISMTDPARIIDTDITCGMIAGVPTVIVQPDALLLYKDRMRDMVEDMIEDTVAADNAKRSWGERIKRFVKGEQHPFAMMASTFPRSLMEAFKRSHYEMDLCGMPMPVAHLLGRHLAEMPDASIDGRAAYKPANAALVTMASSAMRFEDIFKYKRSFSRMGCPEINPGNEIFRYSVTCHEVGHVAGAAEAQADMVAALFTRRAYGNTPMPQMLADFRAVDIAMTGIYALRGICASGSEDNRYGWEMVEAADAASAVPQVVVDKLNDDDILDSVFVPFKRDQQRTELMIRLLFSALAPPPTHRPWHIAEIVDATQIVKKQAMGLGDQGIMDMTTRLDHAARRLMRGNAGYGI